MQVVPNAVSTAVIVEGRNTGALLAALDGVLLRTDKEHEQRREQRCDADQTAVAAGPTGLLRESERRMEVGSRSLQRRHLRETAQEQFAEARLRFRQALSQARGGAEPGARSPAPAEEGQHGAPPTAQQSDAAGERPRPTVPGGEYSQTGAKPAAHTPPAPAGPQPAGPPAATPHVSTAGSHAVAAVMVARAANAAPAARVVGGSAVAAVKAAAPAGRAAAAVTSQRSAVEALALKAHQQQPGVRRTARGGQPQPAESARQHEQIERMVRVIRASISARRAHTVMRLDPPELGSLRLEMDLRDGALALRVDTSTRLAHRLLSQQLDRLREGLEVAGIRLERVEIRPPVQPATFDQPAAQQGGGESWSGGGGTEADSGAGWWNEPDDPELAAEVNEASLVTAAEPLVNVMA